MVTVLWGGGEDKFCHLCMNIEATVFKQCNSQLHRDFCITINLSMSERTSVSPRYSFEKRQSRHHLKYACNLSPLSIKEWHRGNIAMMNFVILFTCLVDIAFNIVGRNHMFIVLCKHREIDMLHPFES